MSSKFTKLLFLLVLTSLFSFLAAEENVQVDQGGMDLVSLFEAGGMFMWIIALVGVAIIVLGIMKFYMLSVREHVDARKLYLKLKGFIAKGHIAEAEKICENFKSKTMGFIFWMTLTAFHNGKKQNKSGKEMSQILDNSFEEAALQVLPKIDAGLHWFDVLGQSATYLGLLGTIAGLIGAFNALGAISDPGERQNKLTQGIATAMGTTGFGLMIAIPAAILKGYFQGRAEKVSNLIDEYSAKLINQLKLTIEDK
ncbi:MAG: MotA/TolQ/ExbB proton channel family protein [Candidatus Cloacimonetes bacterium]|nr:MotA/TolQ/ExbB proton channel family protein [Candidatus Cloacimonadota bacterium]